MGREYRPKGINECKGIGARDGSGPTLGETHEKGIGCDRDRSKKGNRLRSGGGWNCRYAVRSSRSETDRAVWDARARALATPQRKYLSSIRKSVHALQQKKK